MHSARCDPDPNHHQKLMDWSVTFQKIVQEHPSVSVYKQTNERKNERTNESERTDGRTDRQNKTFEI